MQTLACRFGDVIGIEHNLFPGPNDVIAFNFLIFFTFASVVHELHFACSWITLILDPTVWLDGARPANTYIPPSFPWMVPAHHATYPTSKSQMRGPLPQIWFGSTIVEKLGTFWPTTVAWFNRQLLSVNLYCRPTRHRSKTTSKVLITS